MPDEGIGCNALAGPQVREEVVLPVQLRVGPVAVGEGDELGLRVPDVDHRAVLHGGAVPLAHAVPQPQVGRPLRALQHGAPPVQRGPVDAPVRVLAVEQDGLALLGLDGQAVPALPHHLLLPRAALEQVHQPAAAHVLHGLVQRHQRRGGGQPLRPALGEHRLPALRHVRQVHEDRREPVGAFARGVVVVAVAGHVVGVVVVEGVHVLVVGLAHLVPQDLHPIAPGVFELGEAEQVHGAPLQRLGHVAVPVERVLAGAARVHGVPLGPRARPLQPVRLVRDRQRISVLNGIRMLDEGARPLQLEHLICDRQSILNEGISLFVGE
mmetsp:Transcript_34531/g.50459  ORF Transcript_34531/g.50459 Transcript_34531/m.50459 type:complete len:324 (-) Transcript_34531:415-1386(-)